MRNAWRSRTNARGRIYRLHSWISTRRRAYIRASSPVRVEDRPRAYFERGEGYSFSDRCVAEVCQCGNVMDLLSDQGEVEKDDDGDEDDAEVSTEYVSEKSHVYQRRGTFDFLALPLELRTEIYAYVFAPVCDSEEVQVKYTKRLQCERSYQSERRGERKGKRRGLDISNSVSQIEMPSLLLVCRQTTQEALAMLYTKTEFSLIIDCDSRVLGPRDSKMLTVQVRAVPCGWDLTRIRNLALKIDVADPHSMFNFSRVGAAFRFNFEALKAMAALRRLKIVVMGWGNEGREEGAVWEGELVRRLGVTRPFIHLQEEVEQKEEYLGQLIQRVLKCLPQGVGVRVEGEVWNRKEREGRQKESTREGDIDVLLGPSQAEEAILQHNARAQRAFGCQHRCYLSSEIMRSALKRVSGTE